MEKGIHNDVPIDSYHDDRTIVSSTGLKEAKKSSRHFAYYLTYGSGRKSAFDFGNAFELSLIDEINGSLEFGEKCVILNEEMRPEKDKGITSKKNQEWKKEILSSGKYVVPQLGLESYETIISMVDSVLAEPIIVKLLTGVDYQKSFVWQDECGVMCKTRPDLSIVNKKVIVDIKTTKDASPQGFAREVANYDYPLQAYMQIEGALKSGYLDKIDHYYWLAVEKNAPFNAVLYRFQDQDIQMVSDSYEYYLKRCAKVISDYRECGGKFELIKGYSENADNQYGVIDLEIPLYYKL